jgi:hypothetical protein
MSSDDSTILSLVNKSESLCKDDGVKCVIVLKPAGNAPIIAKNKITILGCYQVLSLYEYVRRTLKSAIEEKDTLFIYCGSNFSPPLNAYIIDLFKNYSIKQELVIFYAITEAWG